ncbi:MAG: hypothetical protein ACLUI7_10630 [Coprococcus sp.]
MAERRVIIRTLDKKLTSSGLPNWTRGQSCNGLRAIRICRYSDFRDTSVRARSFAS